MIIQATQTGLKGIIETIELPGGGDKAISDSKRDASYLLFLREEGTNKKMYPQHVQENIVREDATEIEIKATKQ